jgi:hypothetical protein
MVTDIEHRITSHCVTSARNECPQYVTSVYARELTNLGRSNCPLGQYSFCIHYITEIQTGGVQNNKNSIPIKQITNQIVIWSAVTPCIFVRKYRCLGGKFCLCLKGLKVSGKQRSVGGGLSWVIQQGWPKLLHIGASYDSIQKFGSHKQAQVLAAGFPCRFFFTFLHNLSPSLNIIWMIK